MIVRPYLQHVVDAVQYTVSNSPRYAPKRTLDAKRVLSVLQVSITNPTVTSPCTIQ